MENKIKNFNLDSHPESNIDDSRLAADSLSKHLHSQDLGKAEIDIKQSNDNSSDHVEDFNEAEISSERQEKLKHGIKVVIGGPPHSGKSIFVDALMENLDKNNTFSFSAAPDGEGVWLKKNYADPKAKKWRQKGKFTDDWVEDRRQKINDWDGPLMLIDIGGVASEENSKMIEGATHSIIISGDLSKSDEWRDFFESRDLPVVAKLHSSLNSIKDIALDKENLVVGSVHNLTREEPADDRETIKSVASLLQNIVENNSYYKEAHQGAESIPFEVNTVDIFKDMPGEVVERRIKLDDGSEKVFSNKYLSKDSIPMIYDKAAESGQHSVWINGPMSSWSAMALSIALDEEGSKDIRLKSPDGYIPVEKLEIDPEIDEKWFDDPTQIGEIDGAPVYFVHNTVHVSNNPMRPSQLGEVKLPELPQGSVAVISTQGPNWLKASIALGYKDSCSAIAAFHPSEGSIIAWAKNKDYLGKIVEQNFDS